MDYEERAYVYYKTLYMDRNMYSIYPNYESLCEKEDFTLQNACYFFMFICLLSETTKMMSDMIPSTHGGMHLNPQSLPFHICSILLFIVAYITFGKDGPLKQK